MTALTFGVLKAIFADEVAVGLPDLIPELTAFGLVIIEEEGIRTVGIELRAVSCDS